MPCSAGVVGVFLFAIDSRTGFPDPRFGSSDSGQMADKVKDHGP